MAQHPIEAAPSLFGAVLRWLRLFKYPMLVIALPALLAAVFYYFFISDQYVAEAHFLVKKTEASAPLPTGLGQALSLVGGVSVADSEAASVSDYLSSTEAVRELMKSADLVEIFQRPEADWFSRLKSQPTTEDVVKFYRKQVSVKLSTSNGIVTIVVKAFRPRDAVVIANALIKAGEVRVNELNKRAYENSLSFARRQMQEAEQKVIATQSRLTLFRESNNELDPAATGEAQLKLVTGISEALVRSRAQLSAMSVAISRSSPQYLALQQQIRALEAQQSAEAARIAGGQSNRHTIARNLGEYEQLRVRQELAVKEYAVATADLQKARDQAAEKQLFLVPTVNPTLPEKSLYPERLKIIGTLLAILILVYGIGWLIVAGVKEHAA